jgi:WD40 repeat protein
MLRAIASSPINILLIAAPASWILAWMSHGSPWVFITAAASLIPLAGLIGLGTEQLARRAGPALGGFLNATFGNAAELIIAVVALRSGHADVARLLLDRGAPIRSPMPGGELVRDIPAHRQRIRAIAFSSDGSYVASSGEDRLIHVAPLSGGPGYNLPPRPAKVLSLAFYGPQQLATAGSDNQIHLWDVATKDEIGCLRGHTGSVAALECKNKVLVSAGYDTTVRIWDVGDQVAAGTGEGAGRVGARPELTPRAR